MVQTIQARDISLYDLEEKFGLQLITEPNLFPEVSENLLPLTDGEKDFLARVRSNYFNLTKRRPMSEEAVKMVVLSPLLDLAGFYQHPFEIETETSIEITGEDTGVLVKGNIDVLVIQKEFWILVIESKSTKFDVTSAIPQTLAYLLDSPQTQQTTYGLILNGREFVFLKLVKQKLSQYTRSYALSIEHLEELHQVLSILKQIGRLIIASQIS